MLFSLIAELHASVYVEYPQFLLDFLETTSKQSLRNSIINAIFRLLEVVFYRHRTIVAPPVGHVGNEVTSTQVYIVWYWCIGDCVLEQNLKCSLSLRLVVYDLFMIILDVS